MFAYIVKRLIAGLVVLIIISMMVFALFWYGPESPAKPLCQADRSRGCPPDVIARYEERLGYNNPVTEEYGKWVKGLFVGRTITVGPTDIDCPAPCLGLSNRTRQPVYDELKARLPATISIAVGAATLYLLIGVSVGVFAARRRGTLADKAMVGGTLFLSSIPYYLIALLSMLYMCIVWGILDRGYQSIAEGGVGGWFSHMILPWTVLGIAGITQYARYSRGAMVDSLSEDYIRTAKAKGLTQRVVTYKHALRSALVPVVTIFGLDFAFLLGGTLITEQIFDIQGIGLWGLQATYDLDFPVVQATVLFGATIIVVANIIVDLLYSVLDPRVRLS
jgi:peptide/nickel transport system permease protein